MPMQPVSITPTPAQADTVIVVDKAPSRPEASIPSSNLWQAFLSDTVRTAIGVVAAEVWLQSSAGAHGARKLERAGWYLDPIFDSSGFAMADAVATLSESPQPVQPSIGLAGEMWAEATDGATHWSNLSSLASNEDAPADDRKTAAAVAFGLVGVIPLLGSTHSSSTHERHASHEDSRDRRYSREGGQHQMVGVVLLFTRGTESRGMQTDANIAYLGGAARIGAAIADSEAARKTLLAQKRARSSGLRKLRFLHRSGMLAGALKRERERLESGEAVFVEPKEASACRSCLTAAGAAGRAWAATYLKKWRGVQRAPKVVSLRCSKGRAAWEVAAWTWAGVALTLLCLSALNEVTVRLTDGEYFIMLGSFGALVTLLFGAPSSPLAQPRNAIGGGILSAGISVLFYYVSGPAFLGALPTWIAAALAPATAIALSQRFGVLHPPAGAAALIFITGGPKITDLGWMYLVLPLTVGNIICVLMATAFNNLSRNRQYPLFY